MPESKRLIWLVESKPNKRMDWSPHTTTATTQEGAAEKEMEKWEKLPGEFRVRAYIPAELAVEMIGDISGEAVAQMLELGLIQEGPNFNPPNRHVALYHDCDPKCRTRGGVERIPHYVQHVSDCPHCSPPKGMTSTFEDFQHDCHGRCVRRALPRSRAGTINHFEKCPHYVKEGAS